jgi:[acyl-carrier-protein] S-malonyltransferase
VTLVFMFPGQSSRSGAMFDRIVAAWPAAETIIDAASAVLGRDLRRHYQQPPDEAFATNRDVQVGVFLASYLHQQALASCGITGDVSLGLSLGEYNHLVHIGAVGFEDALHLVDTRGRLYDDGPDGMMTSVFPLPLEELEPLLEPSRHLGIVEVANLNSPGQNVIAGARAAVEDAMARIEDFDPGVQTVVIERRIPMHTSVFRDVGRALRSHLDAASLTQPVKPYRPNVAGGPVDVASGHEIADFLERHVSSPVLWRRSIDEVAARYPDACFVEVGPGAVLFNMLQKSWRPNPKMKTDDLGDPRAQLARVVSELGCVA